MDEAVAYAPVKYRCEVHGTHTAVVNIQAVAEDRREVRRYCMFCLIGHFDGLGLAQVTLEDARERIRKQALDIVTLGQEVGRLREALKKIATIQGGGDCCSVYEWFVYAKRIARAALAEQKSTQEK